MFLHVLERHRQLTLLNWFMILFPMEWVRNVLIPSTNKKLKVPMTLKEFFVFLGCLLTMARFGGHSRHEWWHKSPPSILRGAPFRLHEYMSYRRFEQIDKALTLTNLDP